jgi:hypothetical protein
MRVRRREWRRGSWEGKVWEQERGRGRMEGEKGQSERWRGSYLLVAHKIK